MSETAKTPMSRRRLFAGVGTAGALAATAAALPLIREAGPAEAAAAKPAVDAREGYRLSEHVQRYYQTAKV